MGNGPQRNDDLQAWHRRHFGLEVAVALPDFSGGRLVGGRQAADGIGDAAIVQMHCRIRPAIRPQRIGMTGEAEAIERRIEQLAGNIACEWTAGAIGALLARAKTDHQQFGIQRPEGRNRQCMPRRVASAYPGKVFSEAGTGRAVLWILK